MAPLLGSGSIPLAVSRPYPAAVLPTTPAGSNSARTSGALVLLPGMDGTGELFAPLRQAMGGGLETIVVRYPDLPMDYAAHADVARANLPKDRPYVVLGESFSGPVAVMLAAEHPEGLRGYVLCASFVTCPRVILKVLRPVLGLLPRPRASSSLAESLLMGRSASAELRSAFARALSQVSAAALTARLKAMATVDVRAQLAAVRLPGLYLRAAADRLVPAACSKRFARIAPGARVVDVQGPHFLLQTNPAGAAKLLRPFVESAGAP